MTITWPDNTVEIIDAIRGAIGREIILNIAISGIPCPNITDSLDPVTNLSTNQFCPTCHGVYWLNSVSGVTLSAHVTWKGGDMPLWFPGGFVIDGDCLVQIKYTEETMSWVDIAESFDIDDRSLIKKSVTLRGVPEPNRILVTLVQKDR